MVNIGLTKSLNRGLRLAQGEYIARMDADDISFPERLKTQKEFLDDHPEIGIAGTDYVVVNERNEQVCPISLPSEPNLIKWILMFDSPIAHPSVMMRKDVLDRLNGYDKSMLYGQDYDLWHRALEITQISNVPVALIGYRNHAGSIFKTHRNVRFEATSRTAIPLISKIVGHSVSKEMVKAIIKPYNIDDDEMALESSLFLCELHGKFISMNTLSNEERKYIKSFVTDKLYRLVVSYSRKNVGVSLKVCIRALSFGPIELLRAFCSNIQRFLSGIVTHESVARISMTGQGR